MPTTTAAAAHILSSIKTITDINDGQTDPAVSPAMLLAFDSERYPGENH